MDSNPVDRRIEPRFNVEAFARLKIASKRRSLPARITNVSDHGIGLRVPFALYTAGEAVRIRVRRQAIWGTLKYSYAMGPDIVAGVELKRKLSDEQAKAVLHEFVATL